MRPLQFQQVRVLINSGTIQNKTKTLQSIHAYVYIIYTYIYISMYTYIYIYICIYIIQYICYTCKKPNRIIIVNLRQHLFSRAGGNLGEAQTPADLRRVFVLLCLIANAARAFHEVEALKEIPVMVIRGMV